MNPPWGFSGLVILLFGLLSEASENPTGETDLTAKERIRRENSERERRLIPYMTFYLAQSITNPTSGERQNVLIPIQQQQQPNVERINGVAQIQSNNIHNVGQQQQQQEQRYEMSVTQTTVPFQDNGFYPTPSIELIPKGDYKNNPEAVRILSQVYRFKSPGPPVQQRPQQIQQVTPKALIRPTYQQQSPARLNQKYSESQTIKIIPYNPNFSPQYIVTTPRPQHTYTSTKLQNLVNNPYLQSAQNYYTPRAGTPRAIVGAAFLPGKVYAVNVLPQTDAKIAIQRLRPRPEQEKTNLNQIFIGSTTPSPYRTQVKFELEDARVPSIVNNFQLEKIREPLPITNPPVAIPSNYLTENGQITEPPNKEVQNLYYTQYNTQERPTQITFVPVRTQSPPLAPETVQIKQVVPIQSTPVSEMDIVQETNTLRPEDKDNNGDIAQEVSFEEYKQTKSADPERKPILDASVVNLLTILKQTNQLPQSFTPENIDSSIKTLALILERFKNERKFQSFSTPSKVKSKPKPTSVIITEEKQNKVHSYPNPSGTSTPGRPGIDYPTYSTIPQTRFDCSTQRYKGFFGDPDTNCQVWHYCDLNGGQASFLCPNGTIFSQVALTCDWWFNVKCASTSQLYVLNERLYKYILPFSPSFPEDYSGPLVDRYLAAKFKEMEAKSKLKALKALISTTKPEEPISSTPVADTTPVYNTEPQ